MKTIWKFGVASLLSLCVVVILLAIWALAYSSLNNPKCGDGFFGFSMCIRGVDFILWYLGLPFERFSTQFISTNANERYYGLWLGAFYGIIAFILGWCIDTIRKLSITTQIRSARLVILGILAILLIVPPTIDLATQSSVERDQFFEQATVEQNIGLCSQIEVAAQKDDCLLAVAIEKDDVEGCVGVAETGKRTDCILRVFKRTGYKNTTPSLCASIAVDRDSHDYCFTKTAVTTGDMSLCANIQAGGVVKPGFLSHRDACYRAVFQKEAWNATVCQNAPTDKQDLCYRTIAQGTGNSALCQNMTTADLRSSCSYSVLMQRYSYPPESACQQLIEPWRQTCIDQARKGNQ